jgi:hypothetical protein
MAHEGDDKPIPIISDHQVEQIDCGALFPPNDWSSRRLYVGQQGADNWQNVVNHSSYPLQGQDPFNLSQNRSDAIDNVSVATMISLGSGDAHHDLEIVERLKEKVPELLYFPLDLSRPLLDLALQTLKAHVNIPAGLLCDFEELTVNVKRAISDLSKKPILFSLLGGTIGNLDLGESRFFAGIQELMTKDDRLIIDVPLAGPAWTAEEDPRFKKKEYTEEFKCFLAQGLALENNQLNGAIHITAVENRVDCRIGNGGDIPETKTVTIFDTTTNQVILKFCRYRWESIVQWLSDCGFEVIYHRCSIASEDERFGMGIVMLGTSKS